MTGDSMVGPFGPERIPQTRTLTHKSCGCRIVFQTINSRPIVRAADKGVSFQTERGDIVGVSSHKLNILGLHQA